MPRPRTSTKPPPAAVPQQHPGAGSSVTRPLCRHCSVQGFTATATPPSPRPCRVLRPRARLPASAWKAPEVRPPPLRPTSPRPWQRGRPRSCALFPRSLPRPLGGDSCLRSGPQPTLWAQHPAGAQLTPDACGQTAGEPPGARRGADTGVSGNPRPGSRAWAPWPTKPCGALCAPFNGSHERGAGTRWLVAPRRSHAQNGRDPALRHELAGGIFNHFRVNKKCQLHLSSWPSRGDNPNADKSLTK